MKQSQRSARRVRRGERPLVSSAPQIEQGLQPRAKASSRRRGQLWRWGGVLILAAGVFWWAGLISRVEVSGSLNAPRLEALVKQEIDRHFLYRHLFWLPADTLAESIQLAHPDVIQQLEVRKNWLGRGLSITVEERQPVLRWQTNRGIYGVDQQGVVTGEIGEGAETDDPLVTDSTNLDVKVGQPVAPARFVAFVRETSRLLPAEIQAEFRRGRVLETTNELFVDSNQSYYLRLDTTRAAAEQVTTLKSLLAQGITPNRYIDLRIPYKIYYQ